VTSSSLADYIIAALQRAGVRRLFGMPGGGSNADLIEAAGRAGLPFTLAHTETASAFMASAQAELTGRPGAIVATLGPGAASVMNGVANALLDRIPLLVLTDCYDEDAARVMQHQVLRHGEMFAPITKWSARLRAEVLQTSAAQCAGQGALRQRAEVLQTSAAQCAGQGALRQRPAELEQTLQRAVAEALGPPAGPVHLDCGTEVTGTGTSYAPVADSPPAFQNVRHADLTLTAATERALRQARRPIFLVGLGARTPQIAAALRNLCERHGIPALVTYKAKGVIPDRHPWFGGVLTHGALERPVLEQADLFIAVGLDPVELLPRPWTYPQPLISLSAWQMSQQHIPLFVDLVADVVDGLHAIGACLPGTSEWDCAWLQQAVQSQRAVMRAGAASDKLLPYQVVELAAEAYPDARVTVDAGAHMFPVLSLWPAQEPCGLLISNGLATMGFALPAAIGAALLDNSKPTLVFTGDGGLLMCMAELRTAARERVNQRAEVLQTSASQCAGQENLRLRIIVFDDSTLSLIGIKQAQRGYRQDGVNFGAIDWPALSASLGVPTYQATDPQSLEKCLRDTMDHAGPVMIAARIDPEPYLGIMRALRG
jgi:acetolactate synthase I/II/III large subunit